MATRPRQPGRTADTRTRADPYDDAMRSLLRSVLAEPRAPGAPARVWRDWAMIGVAIPTAVVEAAFRPGLPWPWPTLALTLMLLPALLWRRTHPLTVVAACFGGMLGLGVAQIVGEPAEAPGLYTGALLVLSLYALFRWGSGREVLIGTAIAVVTATVSVIADYADIGEAIGGYTVLGVVMLTGAAVRFLDRARRRDREQIRSTERERLARDLHDTVAHHVSAIAISAQAGLAVADTRPDASVDALRTIEAEASRTLAEMRSMVGVLRRDEAAALAPTPTLADVRALAGSNPTGPTVMVEIDDTLDDVPPSVATTVFRLAQESITNARRHARRATRIVVEVRGDTDTVHLRVSDDGEPVDRHRVPDGYGIAGMIERAGLLGGTCTAGPGADRGWVVSAELPRNGVPT